MIPNKTISIDVKVHEALKGLKTVERESFSDVIRRLIDGKTTPER
ncbi:MAG TPA: hypothetical protein DCM31_06555 [Deferribacteraceae bacterium]|nr:hypothetical protein [Deferribacteraceae bacterium]